MWLITDPLRQSVFAGDGSVIKTERWFVFMPKNIEVADVKKHFSEVISEISLKANILSLRKKASKWQPSLI